MKQLLNKFKIVTTALALAVSVTVVTVPVPAFAVCGVADNTAKGQVLQGAGATGSDCSGKGVTNIVRSVVNILSYIIGIAAIIVVLLAGLKYITSSGDSSGISSAKTTLIYALVGLAIAALAQVLVHFVLDVSSDAANGKVTQLQTAGRSLEAA